MLAALILPEYVGRYVGRYVATLVLAYTCVCNVDMATFDAVIFARNEFIAVSCVTAFAVHATLTADIFETTLDTVDVNVAICVLISILAAVMFARKRPISTLAAVMFAFTPVVVK